MPSWNWLEATRADQEDRGARQCAHSPWWQARLVSKSCDKGLPAVALAKEDDRGKKPKSLIPIEQIDEMIRTIRGVRVILDRDLAKIYGVPTKAFNQAVKRNQHRFLEDFMFRVTQEEARALQVSWSQIVTLKRGQNI